MKIINSLILLLLLTFVDAYAQGDYILNRNSLPQTADFWITGYMKSESGLTIVKDGQEISSIGMRMVNSGGSGANFQLTSGALPGLSTWMHDGVGWQERMRILNNGNIGIGLKSPTEIFHVRKDVLGATYLKAQNNFDDPTAKVGLALTTLNGTWRLDAIRGGGCALSSPGIESVMHITNYGEVGIGTTRPGAYKLAVEGTIGARKVKVTTLDWWADFVFQEDYPLLALKDLEVFIKDNKHLPGIPTTQEVKKEGIDLGEMNAKLLQKIEEQTLYIIELNKKLEEVTTRLNKLEDK